MEAIAKGPLTGSRGADSGGGKTAHLSIHLPKHNAPKLVDEDNGRDNEHESSHIGFIQRPAL